MNTFKTAVVLATLLGVGYGVHVVLNKPLNTGYQQQAEAPLDEFGLPRLKLEGLESPGAAGVNNMVAVNGDFQSPQNVPDRAPDYQYMEDEDGGAYGTRNNAVGDSAGNALNDATNLADTARDSSTELDLDPAAFPELPSLNGQSDSLLADDSPPQVTSQPSGQPTWPPPDQQYPDTNLPTLDPRMAHVEPSANDSSLRAPSDDATQLPPFTAPVEPGSSANGSRRELPIAAASSAFSNVWQSAEDKIQAGQFDIALLTLSLWYGSPELTSEQRAALIPLLDELAGKVIYSREHHMGAPHTVRAGETLSQIAANYSVTPEFLARVNGLDDQTVLTSGQQLKIVTGPFRAEFSLGNREITVFVGRYYAGRFMAGVGRDLPLGEMALEVAEKSGGRPYLDRETNQQTVAGDPKNPYGNYWIGLRVPGAAVNPYLGLHSTGNRVEASDTRGCVSLSDRDADDLQAILTIGSRFTVQR